MLKSSQLNEFNMDISQNDITFINKPLLLQDKNIDLNELNDFYNKSDDILVFPNNNIKDLNDKKNKYFIKYKPYVQNILKKYNNTYYPLESYFSFKLNNKYFRPVSRAFYKLTEILNEIKMMEIFPSSIRICCQAEGPGSFIQALINYRKHHMKQNYNDTIYGYTLLDLDEETNRLSWNRLHKVLDNDKNIILNDTLDKKANGNLLDSSYIDYLYNEYNDDNKKFNFYTADGTINNGSYQLMELDNLNLIFSEILASFIVCKKESISIIKIHDSFYDSTIFLIKLLMYYYDNVSVYKPFTSPEDNSEKYLICKGFKGIDKSVLNSLIVLHKTITSKDNENKYILKFRSMKEYDVMFKDIINSINTDRICEQSISFDNGDNIMNIFLNNKSTFNEDYDNINELNNIIIKNIDYSKKWVQTYMPYYEYDIKIDNVQTQSYNAIIYNDLNDIYTGDQFINKYDINGNDESIYIDNGYNENEVSSIISKLGSNISNELDQYINIDPTDNTKYNTNLYYRSHNNFNNKCYNNTININLHLGQRKLLLAEIRGLTTIFKNNGLNYDSKAVCLYVGSASGQHIPLLSDMFPNVIFILVDPNNFHKNLNDAKYKNKIFLYNKYFVDDYMLIKGKSKEFLKQEAEKSPDSLLNIKDMKNIFDDINKKIKEGKKEGKKEENNIDIKSIDIFISDIRTAQGEFSKKSGEDYIKDEMEDSMRFVRILKPKYGASLKYRPPYIVEKDKEGKIYPYTTLFGEIQAQCWAPKNSTETRLIVPPYDETKKDGYDNMTFYIDKYDNWFYYLNRIIKNWINFANPVDEDLYNLVQGYDGCYNCSYEAYIIKSYLIFKNKSNESNIFNINGFKVSNYMSNFSKYLGKELAVNITNKFLTEDQFKNIVYSKGKYKYVYKLHGLDLSYDKSDVKNYIHLDPKVPLYKKRQSFVRLDVLLCNEIHKNKFKISKDDEDDED